MVYYLFCLFSVENTVSPGPTKTTTAEVEDMMNNPFFVNWVKCSKALKDTKSLMEMYVL